MHFFASGEIFQENGVVQDWMLKIRRASGVSNHERSSIIFFVSGYYCYLVLTRIPCILILQSMKVKICEPSYQRHMPVADCVVYNFKTNYS